MSGRAALLEARRLLAGLKPRAADEPSGRLSMTPNFRRALVEHLDAALDDYPAVARLGDLFVPIPPHVDPTTGLEAALDAVQLASAGGLVAVQHDGDEWRVEWQEPHPDHPDYSRTRVAAGPTLHVAALAALGQTP